MATGYTADIENGISFLDFVKQCARAFGACIDQRDDKLTPELKMTKTTDSYYEQAIRSAEAEISKLEAMDEAAQRIYGQKHVQERIKDEEETIKKKSALNDKYEAMLKKVNKWNPPTPEHEGLKRFMQQQIIDSIKWDCDIEYHTRNIERLNTIAFDSIVPDEIKFLKERIVSYRESAGEQVSRNEENNLWKQQLIDSLKEFNDDDD